jgi:hypothetical protein
MYFSDCIRCGFRYKWSCLVKEGCLALEIINIPERPSVKPNNDI